MCLQSHYRKQLTFSYEALDSAANAYKKLKSKVLSLKKDGKVNEEVFNKFNDLFKQTLSDDLNTANALSVVYDVLKYDVDDKTKYELINAFDKVLSLDLTKEEKIDVDMDFINKKINERIVAKQNKDFALADNIRNELEKMGIILKDTREGTIFEIINK